MLFITEEFQRERRCTDLHKFASDLHKMFFTHQITITARSLRNNFRASVAVRYSDVIILELSTTLCLKKKSPTFSTVTSRKTKK